jgi:hypothetical protein
MDDFLVSFGSLALASSPPHACLLALLREKCTPTRRIVPAHEGGDEAPFVPVAIEAGR